MNDNQFSIEDFVNAHRRVPYEALGEKLNEVDPAVAAKAMRTLAKALMLEAKTGARATSIVKDADCEGVDREAYKSLLKWLFDAYSLLSPGFSDDDLSAIADPVERSAATFAREKMPEGTKFVVEKKLCVGEWGPVYQIFHDDNGDVVDERKPYFVTRFAAERCLRRCEKDRPEETYRIAPVK